MTNREAIRLLKQQLKEERFLSRQLSADVEEYDLAIQEIIKEKCHLEKRHQQCKASLKSTREMLSQTVSEASKAGHAYYLQKVTGRLVFEFFT